ncbi:MAG: hypothetical protein IJG38_09680 [Thermoguttaceae bacterium]|nr:hypothetical protein [Thermoguttaceae bacterium]MBQ6615069.1 hypothetical protein [Thermoguttaceae bacterium]
MQHFIQNIFVLADNVSQGAVQGTAEAVKSVAPAATTWQQIVQFYSAHSVLINTLTCIAIVTIIAIPAIRFIQQKQRLSYLDQIADSLANWLSKECAWSAEELKSEFLLLLNGKKSPKLSGDIIRLTCQFTKISSTQCTREVSVLYKKEEKTLQTTFSSTVDWYDLPGDIRDEFIMKNCNTVVYDFAKQSIIETK